MTKASIDSYLAFKVFDIFRDRFLPIINSYRKDETDTKLYQHIFMAPEGFSKKRAFQVKGVASPFICFWATSPLQFNKKFYARSVLPQDFLYKDADGKECLERGFLYDFEKSFELSASSYFADFRGRVNQDILDLDRLRYLKINVDQLLYGYSCVVELELASLVQNEQVDQAAANRSFNLGAKYTVRATLPVLSKSDYLEQVSLYLQSEQEWAKQAEEVEVPKAP